MTQDALDKPVPIIFAVCQGWQELRNGTFNLLAIFDKLIVQPLPDGTVPQALNLPITTTWTGGKGEFTQILKVLDQDGNLLREHPTAFKLASPSARHNIIALLSVPIAPGVITLTVGRPDLELLRQDFTFEVLAARPAP